MQSPLIFHKTLIKTKWKSEHFKVLVDLAVFQQLRKLWKEGGGKEGVHFALFIISYVHMNFQYKLKYHTSFILFIVTFHLFSSIALLIVSRVKFHCFFFFNFLL